MSSVSRTREEALFASAVLLRKLQMAEVADKGSPVLMGVFEDLGVSAEEVESYLKGNLARVDEALARGLTR